MCWSSTLILDRVFSDSRSDVGNLVAVGVDSALSERVSIMQRVKNKCKCLHSVFSFYMCSRHHRWKLFIDLLDVYFTLHLKTPKDGTAICCAIADLRLLDY